jgi:hypothetical protein
LCRSDHLLCLTACCVSILRVRRRRGAELLIVIGIVALLFPVIQNAREGGWRTRCLAQMHQLGQSVLAYLADFNETYLVAA